MKLIAFLLSFLLFPIIAMAAPGAVPIDPGVDLAVLLQTAMGVISDWQTAGALAGLLALVQLLMKLSKLSIFDAWLGTKKWLRPLVAAILGGVTAFLTALSLGKPALAALVAGIGAGLASSGFHELMVIFDANKRAERSIGSTMAKLMAGDALSEEKVKEVQAAIAEAAAQTTPDARLKALAAYANARPAK